MIHLSGEINRLAGYRSALLDMGMELDDGLVPVHANDRDYDRGAVARAWSFRTDRHLLGQFTRLNVPRARDPGPDCGRRRLRCFSTGDLLRPLP